MLSAIKAVFVVQQLAMPLLGRQLMIAVEESKGTEGLWCAGGVFSDWKDDERYFQFQMQQTLAK